MNRLTVISPAYYDSLSPYLYLSDSCERLGLPLHTYGMGEPWPWLLEAKVVRLAKEIEQIDSEYFLMSDAGDSFILDDAETIMQKYFSRCGNGTGSNFGPASGIIVSAEKKCWPNGSLADIYPTSTSPWQYLNSGGFIGTKSGLLGLLAAMQEIKVPSWMQCVRTRDWINDQFLMSLLYIEGYPLQLDRQCSIFQCMGDSETSELEWSMTTGWDNPLRWQFWNNKTGNSPSVLHFNGHTPGIEQAYEKRFALDATRC